MINESRHDPLILIVEDELSIIRLFQSLFRGEHGWQSIGVNCGPHAIEAWDSSDVDLILMDLQLPMMGGIKATRIIRNIETASGRRHIPIIAFTAHVSEDCRRDCLEAGFDDFIAKPAKLRDVIETIRKHLLN